jgi:hypothetical protein
MYLWGKNNLNIKLSASCARYTTYSNPRMRMYMIEKAAQQSSQVLAQQCVEGWYHQERCKAQFKALSPPFQLGSSKNAETAEPRDAKYEQRDQTKPFCWGGEIHSC